VALVVGDVAAAHQATTELATTAELYRSVALRAANGAFLEIESSIATFQRLGATLDLTRADALASGLRTT
jgi:hypothetical protein